MLFLNSLIKRRHERLACEYGAAGIILAAVPLVNYAVALAAIGTLLHREISNTQAIVAALVLGCALAETALFIAPHAIAFLGVCMAIDALDLAINYEDYSFNHSIPV